MLKKELPEEGWDDDGEVGYRVITKELKNLPKIQAPKGKIEVTITKEPIINFLDFLVRYYVGVRERGGISYYHKHTMTLWGAKRFARKMKRKILEAGKIVYYE